MGGCCATDQSAPNQQTRTMSKKVPVDNEESSVLIDDRKATRNVITPIIEESETGTITTDLDQSETNNRKKSIFETDSMNTNGTNENESEQMDHIKDDSLSHEQ